MKNSVITISREFGSGGRTIGQKAAEHLKIPCYNAQLLQKAAEESGFHESYIRRAGEYAPSGFLNAAFSHRRSGPNNADYLWQIQYKIITQLAEKGPRTNTVRGILYTMGRRLYFRNKQIVNKEKIGKKPLKPCGFKGFLVETAGLEPVTSCV